jgi:glutamate dehydrogenase (NAD(P)+)
VSNGVKIVGNGDHTAALYDPKGFEIRAAIEHVAKHRVLKGCADQATIDAVELLTRRCDILVPYAVERVIDAEVAAKLQCRVIAEGANGPTTPEAGLVLAQRNDRIFVIPDILCNAGGVIVSYFEWIQGPQQYFWTKDEVMNRLEHVLNHSWSKIVAREEGLRLQPHCGNGDWCRTRA